MCVKTIIILILLLTLFYTMSKGEEFATRREKAEYIHEWFMKNPSPTYTEYKKDLADANIVEYEDTLKLKQKNRLNVENILENI
jgi:hypothetical protein